MVAVVTSTNVDDVVLPKSKDNELIELTLFNTHAAVTTSVPVAD